VTTKMASNSIHAAAFSACVTTVYSMKHRGCAP
jgi:hypothetical protein